MMKQATIQIILIFSTVNILLAQRQRLHHRSRSPISFQSFDQSSGFPAATPQRATNIATQLIVNSPQLHLPTHQHHSTANLAPISSEATGGSAVLPLFKQSYPGLYVKGHAAASFKYEPTRQVAHHHGPDFQPRNIASSFQQDFGVNPFSSFN